MPPAILRWAVARSCSRARRSPESSLRSAAAWAPPSSSAARCLVVDGHRVAAARGPARAHSRFGRAAFGTVIMQDLVVGPLIVGVLALGQGPNSVAAALGFAFVKAILAMTLILGVGRLALRPIFAPVAAARRPEIFAALTLLVVLAAGIATEAAGLSMAFGALLAGMLVAESPYRHQVAVEIQPFRGLLLGLFFVSVGMSLDTAVLRQQIATVVPLTLALILGKCAIIAGLARLAMLPTGQALRLGLLLSQGGEFAFVLLGVGFGERILSLDDRQQLVVIVILSMMLTPCWPGRPPAGAAHRTSDVRAHRGGAGDARSRTM
jgi:CPA2 family monovalent cation:H+ antiporter-2